MTPHGEILRTITANRPRPIDRNMPADPGPLWLDRADPKQCTALVPVPNRNKIGNCRYGREPITDAMRRTLRWRRRASLVGAVEAGLHVGKGPSYIEQLENARIATIHPDIYRELLDLYADRYAELEREVEAA